MANLIISGVNCNNHSTVDSIAGDYGYSGMVRTVPGTAMTELSIALVEHGKDEALLIGALVLIGFGVMLEPSK